MQTFSLAVPSGGAREGRKNYVFVDEHNRHKRLKVMRACSGCRKRKIKCDSATTNIWPCSACTRLKLVCIPPTIGQDDDYSPQDQQIPDFAQHAQGVHHAADISQQQHQQPNPQLQPSYLPVSTAYHPLNTYGTDDPRLSQPQPYLEGPASADSRHLYPQHDSSMVMSMQASQIQPHPQSAATLFPVPPVHSAPVSAGSDPYLSPDQSSARELSDALGELKIDESGIAPYIRQQKTSEKQPEIPSPDECEEGLPPLHTTRGATVRIPPELLPSDEDAMTYFEIFFTHIHPYVPVVHRGHFYHQWRHDKSSISPLLVETILACAGRGSDDPAQGAQWLALANRHEAAFMEAPRLSTLQALLLLLKAREASPKKGYYYRSWRLVKAMVSMAKDLELDEHYSYHAEGKSCGLSTVECLVQTRVWQTLLAVEIMIGGPQGRTDLGVDPNTVEVRTMWNISDLDDYETERCRQFAYFVRNALNIRLLADAYHKAKKQKNWGADPRIMGNNSLVDRWLLSLPQDLEVSFPDDGSPPWLPSHFVGNMHSHYHLAIIMLHRPQLLASKSFDAGGEWRVHMAMCCSSAKKLCRLQEAILSSFGLSGLFHMQRGISFTLYSILTCTMLHLIAITSPDPEFHSDARMYFTRHMRLLEQCAPSWPLPEVQTQIEGLRLAFSADVNKPFQLKPNFPYGSPSDAYQPTPPLDASSYHPAYHRGGPPMNSEQHQNQHYPTAYTTTSSSTTSTMHPITPPISGQASDKQDSSPLQGYGLPSAAAHSQAQTGPRHAMDTAAPVVDEQSWNPTRIINQWNMAFPTSGSTQSPPSATADPSQPSPNDATATAMLPQQQPPPQPQGAPQPGVQYAPAPSGSADASRMLPMSGQHQPLPQPYNPLEPAVISARDWQQSVASVFDPHGHGLKRRWDQTQQLVSQGPLPNINR